MLNHPLLQPGLVTSDGRSLAWADNAYLFEWPGALVFGGANPVASDAPKHFEVPKDVKDWGRTRYTNLGAGDAPYPDRQTTSPGPAPAATPEATRAKYLVEPGVDEADSPDNPQFARGNEAAGYEARQTRNDWMAQGRDIRNPVLEELGIKTLAGDFPPGQGKSTFTNGAQWMLDAVAAQFYNSGIIPPTLVATIGAYPAGQALALFCRDRNALEIVQRFRAQNWPQAEAICTTKLEQIEHELFQWVRAGQLPVAGPDGKIDRALTIANATTAIAGIYHLAKLGQALAEFSASAQEALDGVIAGLREGA